MGWKDDSRMDRLTELRGANGTVPLSTTFGVGEWLKGKYDVDEGWERMKMCQSMSTYQRWLVCQIGKQRQTRLMENQLSRTVDGAVSQMD